MLARAEDGLPTEYSVKSEEVLTTEEEEKENAVEELDTGKSETMIGKPNVLAGEEAPVEEIILSTMINGVEITLTAPNDAFQDGGALSLVAEEILGEALEAAKTDIQNGLERKKVLTAYRFFDIKIMDGENEVQPTKPVKVAFESLILHEGVTNEIDVVSTLEKTFVSEPIGVYNIKEKQNEKITYEVEEKSIVIMTEELASFLVAKMSDTYDGNDGENNIAYVHGNFNIFVQGDYKGTHVVGPMLVGGDTEMTGNLGGLSGIQEGNLEGQYQHKVSSYWRGVTDTREDHGNIPVVITGRTDLPIYFGNENKTFSVNKLKPEITPYFFTDSYFDFDAAFGTETTSGWLDSEVSYYQNYQGYSANGRQVKKVEIKKEYLEAVTPTNPESTYEGEGFTIKGSLIGTARNEGEKYEILLDMNYNYVFEEGVFSQLFAIVFNYEYLEELSNTMTIIQTKDRGVVSLPRVYKSVKSDALGDNYDFGSIEAYPDFSVLYLAPNATDVLAGLSTKEYKDKENEFKTPFFNEEMKGYLNGSRLVGHLCVPQANVFLAGGNYNGSIIANNVDAICCGAEGHMWPFRTNEFDGDLNIYLKKTIEGKAPGENKFLFTSILYERDGEQEIKISENNNLENIDSGLIGTKFHFDNPGKYRIRIMENELFGNQDTVFTKDPVIYEADIEMTQDTDGNKLIPSIQWFRVVTNAEGERIRIPIENPTASSMMFNNQTNGKLSVEKVWKDENGEILDVSGAKSITVDLYRSTSEPDGCKVNFEIYESQHPRETHPEFIHFVTGFGDWYIDEGGNITFTAECTAQGAWGAVAGIDEVVVEDGNVQSERILQAGDCITNQAGESFYTKESWKISNITQDIIVKIYFRNLQGANTPVTPEDFELYNVRSDSFADSAGKDYVKSITLSQATNWQGAFYGLPEDDGEEPIAHRYYYSVQEHPTVPGFSVTYDGDTINTGEGNIVITNQKEPKVNFKLTKEDAKNSKVLLPGAEFEMSKAEVDESGEVIFSPLNFKKKEDPNINEYKCLETATVGSTQTLVTDKVGCWNIEELPTGRYFLKEKKAPDGYNLDSRLIEFDLGSTEGKWRYWEKDQAEEDGWTSTGENSQFSISNSVFNFTFTNTPGVELPETGSSGTGIFAIGGILFMGMSLVMIFYQFAKRRKEDVTVQNG